MLTAILSLLGVGGIGAALVFVPGLAGRALGWLKTVFGIVADYPWQAALIAALAACAWLWHGKSDALDQRDAARAETKALAADYERAQVLAAAKQADADHREYVLKSDLAEKAHALAVQSAADARSAVDAYARAHPLRCDMRAATPHLGQAGGTADPGLPGDPGRVPDPDAAADMVAVSRADLDTLAGKAVQDAVKGEFLNAMVTAGWAVPASKLPDPAYGHDKPSR